MRCPVCHRRFESAACPRDGFVGRPRAPVQPPRIAGVEVEALLGGGGGGHVWAVRRGGTSLALKVGTSRPHLAAEATALAELGPPLTPALLDADLDAPTPWLLLERLADGETLAAALTRSRAPVAAIDSLQVTLEQLHARGWAWGDVKPENVWLASDGTARALDFGLARRAGERATPSNADRLLQRVGTPLYMAPELWEGASVTPQTDVYAWAAVAWEVLTGLPPFVGTLADVREAHLHRVPRGPPSVAWLVPYLAKAPAERPPLRRRPKHAPAAAPLPSSAALVFALAEADVVLALVPTTQLASAAARGATLLKVVEGRGLVAFPGLDVASALDRAAPLAQDGVVHLARCEVVRGVHGFHVLGAAVNDPTRWSAQAPGFTDDAQARLGLLERALPHAPLEGRGLILETVRAAAREAVAAQRPTWVWLSGEDGVGRSRVLDELAAALRTDGVAVARAPEFGVRLLANAVPAAVVLDDGERLTAELLARLESLTLEESARPFVVIIAVPPSFVQHHPAVGERAAVRRVIALPPLDTESMEALARHWLKPAEFVPAELTQALVAAAGGRPAVLASVLQALQRQGRLLRDARGEWRLGPGALEELRRQTGAAEATAWSVLPEDYARVAVVGAGLGDCFSEAEVAQVAHRLPPQLGFEGLDPHAVLARLVGVGVLRRDGDQLGFARVSTAAGLLASAPPALVTAVHTAVVDASADWAGETHHRRRARALMALGRTDEAWHNARWLGESALARYQDVEAEEWLTQALAGCPTEAQVSLLRARAKSRRRRQDFNLALEDLDGALLRATSSAERLAIDLERATCFDWLERYDRSVAIGAEVEAELAAGRLALTPGVQLAVGRTALRRGDWQRALEYLAPVWQAADDELAVVAGALGGAALSVLDRLEQAEAVFAQAEARALAADDVVHLGVTLSNRVFLHLKRHDVAFAMRDLERATLLARRAGHATIERWCSHNLAQFHLWGGQPSQALPFARRAHLLAVRFFAPAPPVSSTLLLAGALAALSQYGEASAVLAQLEPLRGGFSAADRAGWLTVTSLLGRRCTDDDIAFLRDAPELQPDQRYDSVRAAARLRPDLADLEARARREATPGLFRDL